MKIGDLCRKNQKYAAPHFVTVENLTDEVYKRQRSSPLRTEEFPADSRETSGAARIELRSSPAGHSQSERDWAYAKRALERGESPEAVIRAIAAYRSDKPNPQYYAEHTVEKAAAAVARRADRSLDAISSER